MEIDRSAAIETVVTFLALSEDYVRKVPVWTFYELVDRAKDRAEKQREANKK